MQPAPAGGAPAAPRRPPASKSTVNAQMGSETEGTMRQDVADVVTDVQDVRAAAGDENLQTAGQQAAQLALELGQAAGQSVGKGASEVAESLADIGWRAGAEQGSAQVEALGEQAQSQISNITGEAVDYVGGIPGQVGELLRDHQDGAAAATDSVVAQYANQAAGEVGATMIDAGESLMDSGVPQQAAALGGAVVQTARDVDFDQVTDTAAAAGEQILSKFGTMVVDSGMMETGLQFLGGSLEAVGAALPGIAVLGFALKGLADTAKRAKYNKELAAAMLDKVDRIANTILPTLVPNLQKASKGKKNEQRRVVEAIQPVIDQIAECRQICEDMCKEGFMKAMFKCSNNKHMLATLMHTLDEKLQALSMKVSERQLDISLEMDSKLDKITMMMEQMQSGGSKSDPAEIDPEILAKIAADAGMKAGVAIQQELGSMSEKMMAKMEEIKGAVNAIASKLDGMDKKLDASMDLQQKSLNMSEVIAAKQQAQHLEAMAAQNQMQDSIQAMAAQQAKRLDESLSLIMANSGGDLNSKKQWANPEIMTRMIERTKEILDRYKKQYPSDAEFNRHVKTIHADGGPKDKRTSAKGKQASKGKQGKNGDDGRDVTREEGADGPNGSDGEDGEPGEPGVEGPEFEVRLEFLKHDVAKKTRTFSVETVRPGGKATKQEITIPYPDGTLIVDGQGGDGGDGGDGGNGGKGGEGGKGSGDIPGGNGGDGGIAGKGASGGNGGKGAKITISTFSEYKPVLMLMEISADGGQGGVRGRDGTIGQGGLGGDSGEGLVLGKTITRLEQIQLTCSAHEGGGTATVSGGQNVGLSPITLPGKKGKNGKPGKKVKGGGARDGEKGPTGEITFVVYGPKGFEESGGCPYRLIFSPDVLSKATLQAVVGDLEIPKDGKLVYGQTFKFGPIVPANVGELRSPPTEIRTAISRDPFKDENMIPMGGEYYHWGPKFEGVAAGGRKATRMGITELDPSFGKMINEKVPSLTDALERTELFDELEYPFPEYWSPSLKRKLMFEFSWTVEGLQFRKSKDDDENDWFSTHMESREVDVPAVLVKKYSQAGKSTSVSGVESSIDDSRTMTVMMGIKSQLPSKSLPHHCTQVMLRVSAQVGVSPVITGDFADHGIPVETVGDGRDVVISSYSKSNILLPAEDDVDSNEKTFKAELTLPEGTSAVHPGTLIQIRAEYWHDGVLAAFGPPATVYIAHPPPPADGNARDALFLCHQGFQAEDYEKLRKLFGLFLMRVVFLDYGHYSTPTQGSGIKNIDHLWMSYHGKSTVVACGDMTKQTTQIYDKPAILGRLASHREQGGAMITTTDWNVKHQSDTRTAVVKKKFFGLNWAQESISQAHISGIFSIEILTAIISTRTIPELIEWLQGAWAPLEMKIGNIRIQRYRYQEELEKSCMECRKIFGMCIQDCAATSEPASVLIGEQSACTVRDLVLEALALYIKDDVMLFNSCLMLPHDANEQTPRPPMSATPKIDELIQYGEQSGSQVKADIAKVLWSQIPLNLDLRIKFNKERPQFHRPGGGLPERKVILNPNAKAHWDKLNTFKGPTSGDCLFTSSEQNIWEHGMSIATSTVLLQFRQQSHTIRQTAPAQAYSTAVSTDQGAALPQQLTMGLSPDSAVPQMPRDATAFGLNSAPPAQHHPAPILGAPAREIQHGQHQQALGMRIHPAP